MEKNGNVYFAITNSKITEEFRDYLKSINRKIVCTYYGFCPYFTVGQNEDVTFYQDISNLISFRFHRGGFKESMETKKEFSNLIQLCDYINLNYCLCDSLEDISFKFYGYDNRINAYCFLVCVKGKPCGFMW